MKVIKIGIISAGTQFCVDYNSDQAIIFRRENLQPINYFFYVRKSGYVEAVRPLDQVRNQIDICWEGGIDESGSAADTRTEQQKESIDRVVNELKTIYPDITKVSDNPLTDIDISEPENEQANEVVTDTIE